MKIIFVCTKAITFNTFLKSQANYFIKKGFEIKVICTDVEKLDLNKKLKIKVNFPTNFLDLFNLFNYLQIFKQISNLVKKNPTAIFYLHTPLASHLFRVFTFFKKLKIIYFVHGFRFHSKTNLIKTFFFEIIEKILSLKTDIFITINNEDYNYAKSNLINKALCYKINGIGLNLTKNHFKKKIIYKKKIEKILVIAAYKKDKGYLEILKVAEILKNEKIQIDCYGYGNFHKFNSIKIKQQLNNISFKKFDVKLKKKISKYDILLHLSKREGLPVAVMESLSEGLPVICYNIRGNNDLIKNRFNGYFVDTYKDVLDKIYYLNKNIHIFNKNKINAFKSIDKNFLKKEINLKLYNIIKKYLKN